jgi:hypothetical protein
MVRKYNKISDYIKEDVKEIPGLKYYPNFIQTKQADTLLNVLYNLDYKIVSKKPTKYFGVDYTHSKKTHNKPLQELPHYFNLLNPVGLKFDQIEIKYYKESEGHSPICETNLFGNDIVIISLNSHYVMNFHKENKVYSILIEPNSLLSISGQARKMKRSIPYRIKDRYCNTIFERKDFFIFTFRNINQ